MPLNDAQWFDVVKWVVFATIEAEELGITRRTSPRWSVARTPWCVGSWATRATWARPWRCQRLGVKTIAAVGNYGEIYDRNLGPATPFAIERGLNALWTDGGLLYAPPYR